MVALTINLLVGALLLVLVDSSAASSPRCAMVSEEETSGLYGVWQGVMPGEFHFERPFHLEINKACAATGGCLLLIGFHDSVDAVYRSSGAIEFDENGNVVIQYDGSGQDVVLSGVFRACSPVSGTVRGQFFSKAEPMSARIEVVGMKYRKSLFDLLATFSERATRLVKEPDSAERE